MKRFGAALTVLCGAALSAAQSIAPSVDVAFSRFFEAHTPEEASAAADAIVAIGTSFDEAFGRLKKGRTYSREVATGVVQASYRGSHGEYFYTLNVPAHYDPSRRYQVRVQLHGGVGRQPSNVPSTSLTNPRLPGAEQIYVMPYAWRDAPWWSGRQIENLDAILDIVKQTYNVDENRVVLSGVSDGGTGVYYAAMRDTTPFASFLPLNGFIMVLRNETADADGDLFPSNLRNKPFFVVNGGRDPMYPTSVVDPYIDHLKRNGVAIDYRPQPNAGHDTSWWPAVGEEFERFVADHPRTPLPDALSWEAGPPHLPGRAHWLILDRLAPEQSDEPSLPDLNRMATPPSPDFGIRSSGARINRVVRQSNAEKIGLRSGDVVTAINGQPVSADTDVADLLRGYASGRPLLLTVGRDGESVRLTGRYAPTVLAGEAEVMFPREHESGRVDLRRTGNRIEVHSRGVAAFTLLLSPDQFDLNREVTVVANGRTVFDGMVRRDVRTLLEWAARDHDRTMLFAAALRIVLAR